MKVTVERAQLLKSLGHVHRVVERRNTIPILGNVLLRAENAQLSLKATDLDLEVTETLAAEIGTGGSTTVPAHMFYDIVRKLPDGSQIVLEADGVKTVGECKEWTHEKIRPVFPHETLGSSWPPARRWRGLSAFAPVSSKTPPPTLYTIPSAAWEPNNGI